VSIIANLRSASDPQLDALLAEPERLEDFLDDEEDFGRPAPVLELDLDRAWHGIHFLLTGTAVEGQAPLDFLERGGQEVGDVDLGYGPARALRAAEVAVIARALEGVSSQALRERFDPLRMRMLEIYPDTWDGKADEADPLGFLLSYFEELRTYVQRVAQTGLGMLVYLS
jgi:hypothetical protein